ncbi:Na+/H+ antiporter subunit E [Thermotoga neapolitana]|uniref:Cation antiporter n=1 Tax=Thermotoga neapolitana (strain ATCC 49049 / DSM 4359 / NBRC 107923 / NS-E) TaxID=309803 RepID=B9K9A9_THENN|nr:Na+/H+ antiporter subunit E [Thermotoga neapolitana]ACM23542.1 Cation antiporter [Thermotoga neapolitana DSM 4359]KFZ21170.1 monovalent cation/H+ antiporter subunit E [Thermotoga neapolitana LA10]MDK2786282.1 multicomponent Na+:H+ antiporter subunit [Thermotoga sp.]HBF10573.1 Na+/H+ antiporter subunit E [Thermotoga neapolitana]
MSVFLTSLILWLVITGFSYSELIVGIAVSLIVSLVFRRFHGIRFDLKLPLRIVRYLVMFLPVFIVEMVKANIDVAFRVLNPHLPLRPGFVSVRTNLKKNASRLFLANSITLTPGTLSLDLKGDEIFVHWIDVKDLKEKEKYVSQKFEKPLREVFE